MGAALRPPPARVGASSEGRALLRGDHLTFSTEPARGNDARRKERPAPRVASLRVRRRLRAPRCGPLGSEGSAPVRVAPPPDSDPRRPVSVAKTAHAVALPPVGVTQAPG